MAKTFNKLMIKLGYIKYVAQGGDWGSIVTRQLGQLHSEAIHVKMLFTLRPPRITQGLLINWSTLLYDKKH